MRLERNDFIFVGIQILLFLGFLLDFKVLKTNFPVWIYLIGILLFVGGMVIIILALLQLNRNLSPFPTPKQNSELVRKGLYRFIRHPIYTGIILAGIGLGLASDSGTRILTGLLLWVLFYYKSKYEEKKLKDKFQKYENYMKSTGRFFPGF